MSGWKSLKVMLDTYAAVLPDDLAVSIAGIQAAEEAEMAESDATSVDEQMEDTVGPLLEEGDGDQAA